MRRGVGVWEFGEGEFLRYQLLGVLASGFAWVRHCGFHDGDEESGEWWGLRRIQRAWAQGMRRRYGEKARGMANARFRLLAGRVMSSLME